MHNPKCNSTLHASAARQSRLSVKRISDTKAEDTARRWVLNVSPSFITYFGDVFISQSPCNTRHFILHCFTFQITSKIALTLKDRSSLLSDCGISLIYKLPINCTEAKATHNVRPVSPTSHTKRYSKVIIWRKDTHLISFRNK